MNVIEKLNQEFDEIQNKNIKLEKENLQLYKEIHKLKFQCVMGDEEFNIPESGIALYYLHEYWSDELEEAVEKGLEKNVILREIYDIPEPWEIFSEIELVDGNIDANNGEEKELIDSFSGGVFH